MKRIPGLGQNLLIWGKLFLKRSTQFIYVNDNGRQTGQALQKRFRYPAFEIVQHLLGSLSLIAAQQQTGSPPGQQIQPKRLLLQRALLPDEVQPLLRALNKEHVPKHRSILVINGLILLFGEQFLNFFHIFIDLYSHTTPLLMARPSSRPQAASLPL